MTKKAKILYFGVFERPFDTEVYISNTLESLGHTVERRQVTSVRIEELEALMMQEWDFVMLSKGWFNFSPKDAERIVLTSKNKKVGWFWDLCWKTPREWLVFDHPLFKADHVFTSDGGHDVEFAEAGVKHSTLRQGIYEPEAVLGTYREEYAYDVVFVGTDVHAQHFNWEHRGHLLKFLSKTYGEKFRHFGTKEEIRNLELNDLYASAKVVVGDSVYSPHYWSNRLYETTGRGGFLIFPDIPGLSDEFTYYKEIIPYRPGDWSGLKEKIDHYLTHDKEREVIRLAGFERCKRDHTYTVRCKKLIDAVL